jgi:hypothetical protein
MDEDEKSKKQKLKEVLQLRDKIFLDLIKVFADECIDQDSVNKFDSSSMASMKCQRNIMIDEIRKVAFVILPGPIFDLHEKPDSPKDSCEIACCPEKIDPYKISVFLSSGRKEILLHVTAFF